MPERLFDLRGLDKKDLHEIITLLQIYQSDPLPDSTLVYDYERKQAYILSGDRHFNSNKYFAEWEGC